MRVFTQAVNMRNVFLFPTRKGGLVSESGVSLRTV
jgi:hypothetical protein